MPTSRPDRSNSPPPLDLGRDRRRGLDDRTVVDLAQCRHDAFADRELETLRRAYRIDALARAQRVHAGERQRGCAHAGNREPAQVQHFVGDVDRRGQYRFAELHAELRADRGHVATRDEGAGIDDDSAASRDDAVGRVHDVDARNARCGLGEHVLGGALCGCRRHRRCRHLRRYGRRCSRGWGRRDGCGRDDGLFGRSG